MCFNMKEKLQKALPANGALSTASSGTATVRAATEEGDSTGAGVSVDSGSGIRRRRKSSSGLGL